MNIAIFASAFYPHMGGVEELVSQLARQLISAEHRAIILTNRWPRSLPKEESYEGVPIYRLPFRGPDAGLKSRITFAMTEKWIHRQVASILRRNEIEILHVQCVSSNAHYALAARRTLNLPLIVTLQGELTMDATGLFERSEFARSILRQCLSQAEMVTACSQKTMDDGEHFWGQQLGDRERIIFNGASIDDFSSAVPYQHPKPYLFAIGRLVPQKGFDVLLRAFKVSGISSHDLLIAGDGPERKALENLAADLNLDRRVNFLGRADRTRVPALFAGSEFFVLPSIADEGLPVVTAEAMAAGKAIVATRSGGAPEAVLDGITGLIVPKNDVAALADAMRQLAENPDLRAQFAQAGRTRASVFGWPAITDEYVACYNSATERSRRNHVNQMPQVATAGVSA